MLMLVNDVQVAQLYTLTLLVLTKLCAYHSVEQIQIPRCGPPETCPGPTESDPKHASPRLTALTSSGESPAPRGSVCRFQDFASYTQQKAAKVDG